ncbi:MAG: D-aminoacyl-tRNA deacylase [Providencia heimbachae]|nr:D-aminoacyl-tRNA deacylase [Providencia heimbachae]
MKVVIQRVLRGCVTVEEQVVGQIGKGIAVLVGICRDDTEDDVEYIIRKLLNVRMWSNEDGSKHWCRNVREVDGGILLVSQFTLMHVMKGSKPDFHHAMAPQQALAMFNTLRDRLRAEYTADKVATGAFQHYMHINQVNDGPVTFVLDSRRKE